MNINHVTKDKLKLNPLREVLTPTEKLWLNFLFIDCLIQKVLKLSKWSHTPEGMWQYCPVLNNMNCRYLLLEKLNPFAVCSIRLCKPWNFLHCGNVRWKFDGLQLPKGKLEEDTMISTNILEKTVWDLWPCAIKGLSLVSASSFNVPSA